MPSSGAGGAPRQFWQKRQWKLQPTVAMEQAKVPGKCQFVETIARCPGDSFTSSQPKNASISALSFVSASPPSRPVPSKTMPFS